MPPANGGPPILVPPSGHVCGIFARTDTTRGVHKAPANEIVNGALGVERRISRIEQGQLNPQGINVMRVFQAGGRPIVWGARTTATDPQLAVRQHPPAVPLPRGVDPGGHPLGRLRAEQPGAVAEAQAHARPTSCTRAWRDGALFGATAEEAFYVRIDEALNPFSEQQLGRLYIEIGVRPTYPAEFIVVRIGIWDGGSEVTRIVTGGRPMAAAQRSRTAISTSSSRSTASRAPRFRRSAASTRRST